MTDVVSEQTRDRKDLVKLEVLHKMLIEAFVSGCRNFDREVSASSKSPVKTVMSVVTSKKERDSLRIAFDPKESKIFRGLLSMFQVNVAGGYESVAPVLQELDMGTLTALKRFNEINLIHIKRWPIVQRVRPVIAVSAGGLWCCSS
jgi:hypothetical protein